MGRMGRMGLMVFGSGRSVGVAAGAGGGVGGRQNAEVGGPTDAVSGLAFSVSSLDICIIMGQLKHTSEKVSPYRTDEMQVKNGVFDRERSLVKTR
jgi:hypothetical protein